MKSSRVVLAQPPVRNGRIPDGETRAFFELYCRGREELRAWLTDGSAPHLIARLP
jgi:hypothetical protein